MKRFIACAACLVLLPAIAAAKDPPKVTTQIIKNTDKTVTGQQIVSPEHPNVVVTMATFAPGARLPVHKHLYPHYGYVVSGVLSVTNEETHKSFDLKPGEFLVEMNNTWHYGQNKGAVPVKLLVIDHLPKGVTSNVVLKDAK